MLAQQILGNMLKQDGEIVDILLLLADEDTRIKSSVESLLQTLHSKDPGFVCSKFL